MNLELDELKRYLESRHDAPVHIGELQQIGSGKMGANALKQFGYGRPLLVAYQAYNETKQEVFHRIRQNAFGREREDDRVAAIWLDFNTINRLPRHVPTVDMIMQTKKGNLRSRQSPLVSCTIAPSVHITNCSGCALGTGAVAST